MARDFEQILLRADKKAQFLAAIYWGAADCP